MIKAVVFDLFETLITEWGHEKYTKKQMSKDCRCNPDEFAELWEALHEQQYRGEIGFQDSIRYICGKMGVAVEKETLKQVTEHRILTKSACFDELNPGIISMLRSLRAKGYKLAILSNCSEEEVGPIRESVLASLMDEIILSYETGLCKPRTEIYELTARKLGVGCDECVFIGDGGSRELYGAQKADMYPMRALWYIRQMPHPIKSMPEFETLEEPTEVLMKI